MEKAAKNYNKVAHAHIHPRPCTFTPHPLQGVEKGLHNPEGLAAVQRFMAATIIQALP